LAREKVSRAVVFAIVLPFALGVGGLSAGTEHNGYPLRADDGSVVANARVPLELAHAPDVVAIGGREGSLAITEFYDLNCPYCRKAAPDIADLIHKSKDLRIVLVSFPVLSTASIEAARVELAVRQQVTPEQFYDFHRRLYTGRGVVDGVRGLPLQGSWDSTPEHSRKLPTATR
jgi:protein-disulfide isomerase